MTVPPAPRTRIVEWVRTRFRPAPPAEPPTPPEEPQQQQKSPSRTHTWLNTASTFLTALFAIPALILAVITYQDQKADAEEGSRKEAARITWYWIYEGEKPTHLVVENRSLRAVYNTLINIEEDDAENRQVFFIDGTVSPCTRVSYALGKHGVEVMSELNAEMFFTDSLGHLWRTDYSGGVHDKGERGLKWSRGLNKVAEWNLSPKYEDLEACA
ncbi:hypothetical protein ACIQUU_32060 [Streptomyces sp. NPDC101116]|uniref:hypothetical protein n=1 Tax=Streptomyces sp. NPDC101116 TaxID=3366107 RepID=UPI003809F08F